jgi:hypothetical protein
MAIQSAPLNLLLFPQRWVPNPPAPKAPFLSLSVLVIPKGDPREAVIGPAAFADADLAFEAAIVPSLAALPTPAGVASRAPLTIVQPPNRRPLFDALSGLFKIRPQAAPAGPAPPATVRKFLPHSYQQATRFASPRTTFASVDSSYLCTLEHSKPASKPPDTPDDSLIWEEVLGFVLRQPMLARAMGLIFDAVLPLPGPNPFAAGGYLFADLGAASEYHAEVAATPSLLARFAARIPALEGIVDERPVFASVLFPVTGAGSFDDVFVEAEEYDDGFARIVHGAQPRRAAQVETDSGPLQPGELPPPKDAGIRLGWDDEQIAIWHNRQFGTNAYDPGADSPDSPMGVAGFRVDVQGESPGATWTSLAHVTGALAVGGIALGAFDGELTVEAVPVNHTFNKADGFWLPSYFTAWAGGSIVVADPLRYQIANQPGALPPPVYTAVDADIPALRYGHSYRFRVRMADLTGGGPLPGDSPAHTAPAPIATVMFRRFVPPKAVEVDTGGGLLADGRSASYSIRRPPLGYPEIAFTGFDNAVNLLLAEAPAAFAAYRETALPDPDATQLRIDVQVRTLDRDPAGPWLPLYSVTRSFPADPPQPIVLNARFEDVAQASALGDADPLPLPSSRDIRLVLTAIGAPDPALGYWGSDSARTGVPVNIHLRAPAQDERALLKPSADGPEIQAIFLQPDPPPDHSVLTQLAMAGLRHDAPADLTDRLADQLRLAHDGLTFSATAGERLVIGASHNLRHTLNPDASSITFSSKADLTRHWIVAIRLTLDRDWTWDGAAPAAFDIQRDGATIGQILMPRVLNVVAAQNPVRDRTELLFLDGYDPKPDPPAFPKESHLRYTLAPKFRVAPAQSDPPRERNLTLPITTPPTQTPKLISAGFAFSEFQADDRYASTGERARKLYFEFDRPPDDPQDRYYARVLAYGPDPMLIAETQIPEPREAPLSIPDELIRIVTLDSSNDFAGLNATQEMTQGPDKIRYLLPLPKGLDPDSSKLFGFFVYEISVGHNGERPCTAHARYGLPLRVAGVQHPYPQLRCSVAHDRDFVTVLAPYADPIFDERNIRPFPPRTRLQALLYAQVEQIDGQGWRNVLLGTAAASPQQVPLRDQPDRRFLEGQATFAEEDIARRLGILGLAHDSPLSVIAVELLAEPASNVANPLAAQLGDGRIYRTSPLTPVPKVCRAV